MLIPTEERKIKRFVRGFNSYLFKAIGAHEFRTYSYQGLEFKTCSAIGESCPIEARELEDELSVGVGQEAQKWQSSLFACPGAALVLFFRMRFDTGPKRDIPRPGAKRCETGGMACCPDWWPVPRLAN
ncbi:hypothetical protein H0E87_009039 [Populus deltoides]|uniref:Uncharacterized protein n=1 Tax=Populus deltoides TaxID=3696 RepID=A0A8T2Z3M5_POPDE|nr:hypothetical protein H0E87_009039 [Populus deltoides]